MPLNDKQERFCQEYIVDLNATQAALRAGYSEKTSYSIGQENLKKPEIVERLQMLMSERSKRTEITADKVLQELAKIGFHNTQDFVNGGNSVLELKHLDRDKVAAVSKVKTTVKEDGTTITEIGFYDKVEALEKLGKHLGIFEKDNSQRKAETNIVIPDSVGKAIDKLLDDSI